MEEITCEIKHEPELIISDNEDSGNSLQTTEDEAKELFKCLICGKEFSFQNQLKYHTKVHNPMKRKKDREALKNLKEVLKEFLKTNNSNTIHKCKICEKEFKSQNYAITHISAHFGSELANCSYCGKNFSSKCAKIIHEKTH